MAHVHDMIIIGGGPGGYTAALYAARAGLDVVVMEKLSAGGQMTLTSQIDNYPGYDEGVDGFELGQKMQSGAERFGAVTELAEVTGVDLTIDPKQIHTSEGVFYGKTVVVATGANPRYLGLPEEQDLVGRGVNYCAHCDGPFYKDKTVVVVGGGNTAVSDALYLSRIAKKVILVHRRDTLRATLIYQEILEKTENIAFYRNFVVLKLLQNDHLTGIILKDVKTGEEMQVACDGLFVSIGRAPATQLVRQQLQLDDAGYIVAEESTCTSLAGVYAVGDVRTKDLRQVVTAVADGAVAAYMAEQYLSGGSFRRK